MGTIRRIHLYLGCSLAPLLLAYRFGHARIASLCLVLGAAIPVGLAFLAVLTGPYS
jgi:hypothetical protein